MKMDKITDGKYKEPAIVVCGHDWNARHNTFTCMINILEKALPDEIRDDVLNVLNDKIYDGRDDWEQLELEMIKRIKEKLNN